MTDLELRLKAIALSRNDVTYKNDIELARKIYSFLKEGDATPEDDATSES